MLIFLRDEELLIKIRRSADDISYKFTAYTLQQPAVSSAAKRTLSCGRSGVRLPGRSNRRSVANDSPPLRRFFGAV